jgi:hypothetical protein
MTLVIQRPRRTGRTTELLKMHLDAENSWYLVHTEHEAVRLRKELMKMATNDWERAEYESKAQTIISYERARTGLRGLRVEPKIFLDNLEFYFYWTLGHRVTAFTMEQDAVRV